MNNQLFRPYAESLIIETQDALKNAPAGSLNIKHSNGTVQYYYRQDGPSPKCTYITKADHTLISLLAQKDYNGRVLRTLAKILARADRLRSKLSYYDPVVFDQMMFAELYKSLDDVYDSLSQVRKDLVSPVIPTTSQYIRMWLEQPYEKGKFSESDHTAYYTKNKVRVRSKSELFIGNFLIDVGLPYKYECPIILDGITVRPDFTILDIYIRQVKFLEHCGMMDDPEYANNFIRKMNLYIANGIMPGKQLLLLYESLKYPLDTRTLGSLVSDNFPYANIPSAMR